MNLKTFIRLYFLIVPFTVYAESSNTIDLFKGITKQAHDNSCGAAALSTLITGVFENNPTSESDVIRVITSTPKKPEEGYSASELEEAAKKLGYSSTKWAEVSPEFLKKLKQPVILLIGQNSDFKHYVIFKGIENDTAFLADPMRGNIQVPYTELVNDGINAQNPNWLAMTIGKSEKQPQHSILYLSDDKYVSHFTINQSRTLLVATTSKKNQLSLSYGLVSSVANNNNNAGLSTQLQNFNHAFSLRYGLSENIEIGAGLQYSDNTKLKINNTKYELDDSNRTYSAYLARSFDSGELLDNSHVNIAFNSLYSERKDLYGFGINMTLTKNTEFANFALGGSASRLFTYDKKTRSLLPEELSYSGFVSLSKPVMERLNASVKFEVSQGQLENKNITETFSRTFGTSVSLTYKITDKFSIAPLFNYYFGAVEVFSFGGNIIYSGGW